ncbi:MAG: DUF4058 family protein [Gemmataceae bacterium]|nr:DUF4058 family protein [Gemmataceae bacterium]
MTEVTPIWRALEQGNPRAAEQLLPLVYDEVRNCAAQRMAQQAPGQTLQATALVRDASLRLVDTEKVRHERRSCRRVGIMSAQGCHLPREKDQAMPIHDWTRVDAGLFHHFHHQWTNSLCSALNAGGLPPDYFALVEQRIRGPIPDVLTLKLALKTEGPSSGTAGVAVATTPPRTRLIRRSEADIYAGKANRITVRHRHGDVVAVIEIVSPGNKATAAELRTFVEKSANLIRQGVHLLVIDLFPPSQRDPQGIAKAIWNEFLEEDLDLPPDKPLTLAAFDAGPPRVAYMEPVAVGDVLPDMPLFLKPEVYVPTPLEATYQTTWDMFPAVLKGLLDSPTAAPPT